MKKATYFKFKEYEIYKNFLNECRTKEYDTSLVLHTHHIIPKCMWVNPELSVNNTDNLIKLSVEDHALAHILFANCYEKDTYEYISNMRSARILNNKSIKDKSTLDAISKTYIGDANPFYGKTHSIELIKRLADLNSKRYKNVSYEERYGKFAYIEKEKRKLGVLNDWKKMTNGEREQRSKNISAALKGKNGGSKNPFAKPILVNGEYYGSVVDACKSLQVSTYKLYKYFKVEKLKNKL